MGVGPWGSRGWGQAEEQRCMVALWAAVRGCSGVKRHGAAWGGVEEPSNGGQGHIWGTLLRRIGPSYSTAGVLPHDTILPNIAWQGFEVSYGGVQMGLEVRAPSRKQAPPLLLRVGSGAGLLGLATRAWGARPYGARADVLPAPCFRGAGACMRGAHNGRPLVEAPPLPCRVQTRAHYPPPGMPPSKPGRSRCLLWAVARPLGAQATGGDLVMGQGPSRLCGDGSSAPTGGRPPRPNICWWVFIMRIFMVTSAPVAMSSSSVPACMQHPSGIGRRRQRQARDLWAYGLVGVAA